MKRFWLYTLPAIVPAVLVVPALILGRKWSKSTPQRRLETPQRRQPMVYVTSFGTKYHRKNCRMLSHSSTVHHIALDEAMEQYEPCSECQPQGAVEKRR